MKTCFVEKVVYLPYLPKSLAEYTIRNVMSRWEFGSVSYDVNKACTVIKLKTQIIFSDEPEVVVDKEYLLNQLKEDLQSAFCKARGLNDVLSKVYRLYPIEKPKGWRERLSELFSDPQ